jgi:hypothetical protein
MDERLWSGMMCELIGGPHDGLLMEVEAGNRRLINPPLETIITGDGIEYHREKSPYDIDIDPYSLVPVKFVFGKEFVT